MKALIVDDETFTRDGLLRHIDWKTLGIDSLAEASDGLDALHCAAELHPDIVISDVKMPHLNGLEFAKELKKTQPDVKFIFLSGFSDKEYLKDAIRLNAVNYVEKPIDLAELTEAIEKSVSLCRQEQLEREESKNANALLNHSLPFIRQTVVSQLISDGEITPELLGNIRLTGLPLLQSSVFMVLIIGSSAKFIHNTVPRCLESALRDCGFISASGRNRSNIILYNFDPAVISGRIGDFFDALVLECTQRSLAPADLFCTAGPSVTGPDQISDSYRHALEMQKNVFFYGYNRLVFYGGCDETQYQLPAEFKSELAIMLKNQQYEDFEDRVKSLCRSYFLHTATPVFEIKHTLYDITEMILHEAKSRGVPFDESIDENSLRESISAVKTLAELQSEILNYMRALFEKQKQLDSVDKSIATVVNYIQRNYSDPKLGVKFLASLVYLAPTYLSVLFKKETGSTISDYILNIRVEQSKKLLLDPRVRAADISQKVGYHDGNYFSKVFKKQTGLSPSVFRERYMHYEK